MVDLLRAAGKEGVLRVERDRHGAIRLFPGANLGERRPAREDEGQTDIAAAEDVTVSEVAVATEMAGQDGSVEVAEAAVYESTEETAPVEPVADAPIIEAIPFADSLDEDDEETDEDEPNFNVEDPSTVRRAVSKKKAAAPRSRGSRGASKAARPRTARPRRSKS